MNNDREMYTAIGNTSSDAKPCFCVGPQVVDGIRQPHCPCSMRRLAEVERKVKNGESIFDVLK